MAKESLLSLSNVGKRFSEHSVLSDVNLEVQPGEFLAVVGRSGCGKTTLLRLIAGLDFPTSGTLQVSGESTAKLHSDVLVLFQDARLLPWRSALGNVELGLSKAQRESAADALRQVGLEHKASAWPQHLSGGQRQRVALARALARQPKLMLLDEPFSALDALTRQEMQKLLVSLWQRNGFGVVLVTHDISEAVTLADRVVLLEQGRMELNLPIPLPRPRELTPDFTRLERQIRDWLMSTTEVSV